MLATLEQMKFVVIQEVVLLEQYVVEKSVVSMEHIVLISPLASAQTVPPCK